MVVWDLGKVVIGVGPVSVSWIILVIEEEALLLSAKLDAIVLAMQFVYSYWWFKDSQ